MPRRDTTHLTQNPINFTNEEVAILRAFAELPNTATKAEIEARAQQILDETKNISQKRFRHLPVRTLHRKRSCP
jgi:hypothetical protein